MIWLLVIGVVCIGVAAGIVTTVFLFGGEKELHQEEPLVEEGEILG